MEIFLGIVVVLVVIVISNEVAFRIIHGKWIMFSFARWCSSYGKWFIRERVYFNGWTPIVLMRKRYVKEQTCAIINFY